jgi:hypothetical protein
MAYRSNHWNNHFSDIDLDEGLSLLQWEYPHAVTAPAHFAKLHRDRNSCALFNADLATVPATAYVFGRGNGIDVSGTRVGGIPCRSKERPWPTHPAGFEYTFLAQFNFSRTVLRSAGLPGDILLVFTLDDDYADLVFEWTALDDSGDGPAGAREIAQNGHVVIPEYFCQEVDIVDFATEGVTDHPSGLIRVHATKVGGLPHLRRPVARPKCAWKNTHGNLFLCSLTSVEPPSDLAWPWINRKEPLTPDEAELTRFNIGDCFSIHFFLNNEGDVVYDIAT